MKKVKGISLTLSKKTISKLNQKKITGGGATDPGATLNGDGCQSNQGDATYVPMPPTAETSPAAGCGC